MYSLQSELGRGKLQMKQKKKNPLIFNLFFRIGPFKLDSQIFVSSNSESL